jgi:hypothetical protein
VLTIIQEFRDHQMQRQGSEVARIAALDREAATAEEALQNLYRLVETGIVSPDEATLKARLVTLRDKRDVAVLARDRARAQLVAPFDVDGTEIERFVAPMSAGLRDGEVGGRKAWIALVTSPMVV